jgi:hypothetical protein
LLLIPALLCAASSPQRSSPPSSTPTASNLPTTNDLARVNGEVEIANNPLLTDAQNLLKTRLNGKNGSRRHRPARGSAVRSHGERD